MDAAIDVVPAVGADLPRDRRARTGAWLLVVSPITFVILVAANAGVFAAAGIGLFADITRAQMDAIAFGWVLASALFPLAYVVGNAGVILLATTLARRRRPTAVWAWSSVIAAALSIALFLPYLPFRVAAMGFTEERLGDNRWFAFWDAGAHVAGLAATVALILLCAAVFTGTRHRTAALVIGALALVYLVIAAIGLLAPPFTISLLWCALGIVWLRARRRRGAALE